MLAHAPKPPSASRAVSATSPLSTPPQPAAGTTRVHATSTAPATLRISFSLSRRDLPSASNYFGLGSKDSRGGCDRVLRISFMRAQRNLPPPHLPLRGSRDRGCF